MEELAQPVLRTWVGQFSIVGGRPAEQGPRLGLFPAKGRPRPGDRADSEAVDLFILVEPATTNADPFIPQLIEAVADLFEREHLSITGGLVRALRAAHGTLLEWNRKSLRQHQIGAGITCLAVHDGLAYLAQAGPSLAYIWTGETLEQVMPELEEAVPPLGLSEAFYPEFRRVELREGTVIILTSRSLRECLGPEILTDILKRGPEDAVMELYVHTRQLRDFSLLLLAAMSEGTASAGTATPPTAGVEARALPTSHPRPVRETDGAEEKRKQPIAPLAEPEGDEENGVSELDLAQRLRRFFGVEPAPEEPALRRHPWPEEETVVPGSEPVPPVPSNRPPRLERETQPLRPISFEPTRWQVLIDRLARLGWPVLALGALLVIGLLVGAWCLVL